MVLRYHTEQCLPIADRDRNDSMIASCDTADRTSTPKAILWFASNARRAALVCRHPRCVVRRTGYQARSIRTSQCRKQRSGPRPATARLTSPAYRWCSTGCPLGVERLDTMPPMFGPSHTAPLVVPERQGVTVRPFNRGTFRIVRRPWFRSGVLTTSRQTVPLRLRMVHLNRPAGRL
jgi:hypothetical protein